MSGHGGEATACLAQFIQLVMFLTEIVGIYMVFSRDKVCPSGCFCCSARRRRPTTTMSSAGYSAGSAEDKQRHRDEDNLRFWSWNGGFKLLLALCGPSMLLMISEWWGFEALAIMAGECPWVCFSQSALSSSSRVLCVQKYAK